MDIDSVTDTAKTEQLQDADSDDSCILEYIEIVPVTADTDGTCTLQEEESDDSCILEYIEILPLPGDTDGSCTTECVSSDCSAKVAQENWPVVKQEPGDVCCVIDVTFNFS